MKYKTSNIIIGGFLFVVVYILFDHMAIFLSEKNDWSSNALLTIIIIIILFIWAMVWITAHIFGMRIKKFLKFLFPKY